MTTVAVTSLVLPVLELHATVPDAQVTLLAPFLTAPAVDAGVVTELGDFFADLTPFAYVLGSPVEFPGRGRHLPLQPVAVFRRIAHSLRQAFPEVSGTVASLGSAVPHLDLPDGVVVPTPLEVHAREARLVVDGPDGTGGFTLLASFPFGTSAA